MHNKELEDSTRVSSLIRKLSEGEVFDSSGDAMVVQKKKSGRRSMGTCGEANARVNGCSDRRYFIFC